MARKGSRVVVEDTAVRRPEWRSEDAEGAARYRQRSVEEVWILDDVDGNQVLDDGWRASDTAGASRPDPFQGDRIRETGHLDTARLGRQRRAPEDELPAEVVEELVGAVGKDYGERLARQLSSAVRSYERDRYEEAFRLTKVLVTQAPESMAAQELHGLVCYRIGKWQQAIKFLSQSAVIGGGVDGAQIPVLMDCHRALAHHRRVSELWEELRSLSPDVDVLVEGRVVLAADLADRGLVSEAIEILVQAGAARPLRHPADRHLRQWYVLADLYERAGDVPRARDLFQLVVDHDPEVADAESRLAALGSPRPARAAAGGTGGSMTLGELSRAQRPRAR